MSNSEVVRDTRSNREDVTRIVLIHELAHFVTLLGTISGALWVGTPEEGCSEKEDVAQDATRLLLRVAGYGQCLAGYSISGGVILHTP